MNRTRITAVALPSLLLLAAPLAAHVGDGTHHHHGPTFLSGFLHPLTGLDHLLAMIAVGLWAAQMGGRMVWALPAAFVLTMLAGGIAALGGMPLLLVEPGIAASIVVLGLLIAMAVRLPLLAGCALSGLFALFHGYAHGAEMAAGSGAALYFIGFALTTAFLHGVGIALGILIGRTSWIPQTQRRLVYQLGGGAVCLAGLVALVMAF